MVKVESESQVSCQSCPSYCISCLSNLTCIQCDTNYVLNPIPNSSNQCISTCPDGYTSDGYQCIQCKINCKKCQLNGRCVECFNSIALGSDYVCKVDKTCGMGKYKALNGTCINCSVGCLSCIDATTCDACGLFTVNSTATINTFSKNNQCWTECGLGYFNTFAPNVCINCPSFCTTCISQT